MRRPDLAKGVCHKKARVSRFEPIVTKNVMKVYPVYNPFQSAKEPSKSMPDYKGII